MMKTEYWGTLLTAAIVLVILAIWTLTVYIERRMTVAPDAPPEYYQRDAFAIMGGVVVLFAAIMGV